MKFKAPPKEPKTAIGIRLPAALAEAFEKACLKASVSISEGVRQLIQDYLDKNRTNK